MLVNVLLMPMSEESLNRLKGSGAIRGAVLCTNPSENVFKAFAAFLTHVDERITVHPSNNEVWSVSVVRLTTQPTYVQRRFLQCILQSSRMPPACPGLRGCAPARPDHLSVHLCALSTPHTRQRRPPRAAHASLSTPATG